VSCTIPESTDPAPTNRHGLFDGSLPGGIRSIEPDMRPDTLEARQRERIPTEIFPTADDACAELATEIAELIKARSEEGFSTVLGLATGSTPVRLYRELVRLHRESGLSFRDVVTFNLDECYGLPPKHRRATAVS